MKTLVGSSAMAKSFAASAVASPYAMHAYPTCQTTSSWYKELDEAAFPENELEADVGRAVVVDEAAAHRQHELAEQPQASTSYNQYADTLKLLLSGGVAGAVSKSCTAPLARLTILFQVQGLQAATYGASRGIPSSLGMVTALQQIVRQEGLRALWKGNGVTIIHRLPYSSVNFWTYEQVNELWKRHIPADSVLGSADLLRRLVAGGTAGLVACAGAYPLDLVRTRLAAQTTESYYRGIGHALRTIVQDEGLRGLYRGLGPTLLQVGPSLAVNYAAYETVRSYWLSRTNRTTPSVGMSLACGSLAGLVSSTATFPLDLVRRRMQLQGQGGSRVVYSSFGQALRSIVATEGVRGLYAGILPEYAKVLPGVAVAFMTYELLKSMLNVKTNATGR